MPITVEAALNMLRYVALGIFGITWAIPTYLSHYGSTRPSPATGVIYPITIHGGVAYGTYWQQWLSTNTAFMIPFAFIALNILLRKLYVPSRLF